MPIFPISSTVYQPEFRKSTREYLEVCSEPVDDFEQLPYRSFEELIRLGLRRSAPVPSHLSSRGSFFLNDSNGQRMAVFKPSLKAGNEALAYALDQGAFLGHYEIPKTVLIRLRHEAFGGDALGSAQQFIPDAYRLGELEPQVYTSIGQQEWEKLNFRLISGSTDWDEGTVLFRAGRLYLIESSDDFAGQKEQRQYVNPWVKHPKAHMPLSDSEASFLHHLDIKQVMLVFEQSALANEQADPRLKVSVDQYLTQVLRLYLAKLAGKYKLTQAEWFAIMTPKRSGNGKLYPGELESIYDKYIAKIANQSENWRQASGKIKWLTIHDELEKSVIEQIKKRRIHRPAFHV